MTLKTPTTVATNGPRGVILLRMFDGNVAARQRFKAAAAALQQRAEVPVLAAFLRPGAPGSDLLIGAAVELLIEGRRRDRGGAL